MGRSTYRAVLITATIVLLGCEGEEPVSPNTGPAESAPLLSADGTGGPWLVTETQTGLLLRVDATGTVTTIAQGLGGPYRVKLDAAGDFVVTDGWNHRLLRVTPNGVVSVIDPWVVGASGLAVGPDGSIYVGHNVTCGNAQKGAITRYAATGGKSPIVTCIMNRPNDLAFDGNGDLIAAVSGSLLRVTMSGQVTTIWSSPYSLQGVSVEPDGNFVVTQNLGFGRGRLLRITPQGAVSTVVYTQSPMAIVQDPSGDFTVADCGRFSSGFCAGRVVSVGRGGALTVLASGLNNPQGIDRYRSMVEIDIKPGDPNNRINCRSGDAVITVPILTTDAFDATTVDHTTVRFSGAAETHVDRKTGQPRRHEEDIDGDGDLDLVFHFRFGDTHLTCDSAFGTLIGWTFDGEPIEGTGVITTNG